MPSMQMPSRRLLHSLATCPLPTLPQCTSFAPILDRTTCAVRASRSSVAAGISSSAAFFTLAASKASALQVSVRDGGAQAAALNTHLPPTMNVSVPAAAPPAHSDHGPRWRLIAEQGEARLRAEVGDRHLCLR